MINVYTESDLVRVIEEYIKLRETVGLARDTAKFGAIKNVVDFAKLRAAVAQDTGLKLVDDASKRQTDKLSSPLR